jgi:hypothetical protein
MKEFQTWHFFINGGCKNVWNKWSSVRGLFILSLLSLLLIFFKKSFGINTTTFKSKFQKICSVLQIKISNKCDWFYLYFFCFLSPYMFRALTGPSSGVSLAVVMLPFDSCSVVDCSCVRGGGLVVRQGHHHGDTNSQQHCKHQMVA